MILAIPKAGRTASGMARALSLSAALALAACSFGETGSSPTGDPAFTEVVVELLGTAADDRFVVGDSLPLGAVVNGPTIIPDDSVRWLVDGTERARGRLVILPSFSAGVHDIIVDALGTRDSVRVRFFDDLGALYQSAPSQSEIDRIQQDFEIFYADGAGADENWNAYPGYAFDQQSTLPSRLAVIAKLDILRRQRFSEPLPFTNGRSVYEWMRANVHRLNMRLGCENNSGASGRINFNRAMSHWDARAFDCKQSLSPPVLALTGAPLALMVHEARHSEPSDPRHITCANDLPGDAFLEKGSGYATGALYSMWLSAFSTRDAAPVRVGARADAIAQLGRLCSNPTHPDPRVQALLRELLGG